MASDDAGRSSDAERVVAVWCEHDHARAILPVDHAIIEATRAPRREIVQLFGDRRAGADRDLFTACATLGRLIAERGGSPTLASATMNGASRALGDADPAWLSPARAALFEGYTAAAKDIAQREAAVAWEYPRCAVRLDAATVAVVPGYPQDDLEALATWAARVAGAASMSGVRRAVVDAPTPEREAAHAALLDALRLAGIDVTTPPATRAWLPWRR